MNFEYVDTKEPAVKQVQWIHSKKVIGFLVKKSYGWSFERLGIYNPIFYVEVDQMREKLNTVKQEPCPFCGTMHDVGYKADSQITCQCGLEIKQVVPVFKQTESGYMWHMLKQSEFPHKYRIKYEAI